MRRTLVVLFVVCVGSITFAQGHATGHVRARDLQGPIDPPVINLMPKRHAHVRRLSAPGEMDFTEGLTGGLGDPTGYAGGYGWYSKNNAEGGPVYLDVAYPLPQNLGTVVRRVLTPAWRTVKQIKEAVLPDDVIPDYYGMKDASGKLMGDYDQLAVYGIKAGQKVSVSIFGRGML